MTLFQAKYELARNYHYYWDTLQVWLSVNPSLSRDTLEINLFPDELKERDPYKSRSIEGKSSFHFSFWMNPTLLTGCVYPKAELVWTGPWLRSCGKHLWHFKGIQGWQVYGGAFGTITLHACFDGNTPVVWQRVRWEWGFWGCSGLGGVGHRQKTSSVGPQRATKEELIRALNFYQLAQDPPVSLTSWGGPKLRVQWFRFFFFFNLKYKPKTPVLPVFLWRWSHQTHPCLRVCVCPCTYAGEPWSSEGSPGLFGGKYRAGDKKEGSIHGQAHSGVNIFCKWKFVIHIVRRELLFTHRWSDAGAARGWMIQRRLLINSADQKKEQWGVFIKKKYI